METIQYRPEPNALTTPLSYRLRFIPRAVFGYEELAAEMVRDNPTWNRDQVELMLRARDEKINELLIRGYQVTLEDAFTYRLSFKARLNEPTDPPPPTEECLRVKVSTSRPFVRNVRQNARLERLPADEKLPEINSAEDTDLELSNVLSDIGVLRLTGHDLSFDKNDPDCGCLIRGTRSGEAVQKRFASISNTEILAVPDIPAQDDLWNNEYRVSVTAQYTEHGSLRTGTYGRRLRTPLKVTGFGETGMSVGILTGDAASPLVSVLGGTLVADGMVRIQAVFDAGGGYLLCSLQDMKREGASGDPVSVRADGDYTLSGFAGSVLSEMNIRVNDYAALLDLVRNGYSGRLVDILQVSA